MTATAPAATTRTRTASPFHPILKVTISRHEDATQASATPDEIGKVLAAAFPGYSCKAVSRSRAAAAGSVKKAGPASLMLYVAPAGHTFAKTAERGVRLDAETANLLRTIAADAGFDPSDSASLLAVAKALASKALASKAAGK